MAVPVLGAVLRTLGTLGRSLSTFQMTAARSARRSLPGATQNMMGTPGVGGTPPEQDPEVTSKGLMTSFTESASKSMKFAVALGGATAAVSQFGSKLKDINQISERLSVVNTSFSQILAENTEAIKSNTLGFSLAAKAITELKVAGFEANNKNIIELISRTKLQGQDVGKLLKVNTMLLGAGNVQEEVIGDLNATLQDTSVRFGIPIDSLVDSIDALANNITLIGATGGTEAFARLQIELTKRLGQENIQQVKQLIQIMSSSNDLNIKNILGLERIQNELLSNRGNAADQVKELMKAADLSKDLIDRFDGNLRLIEADQLTSSKIVQLLANIDDGLATTPEETVGDKFMNTLTVIFEKIFNPFTDIVASFLPSMVVAVTGILNFTSALANFLLTALGPAIKTIAVFVGALAHAVGFIINIITGAFEIVFESIKIVSGLFGGFFENFKILTNSATDARNASKQEKTASFGMMMTQFDILNDLKTGNNESLGRIADNTSETAGLIRESNNQDIRTYLASLDGDVALAGAISTIDLNLRSVMSPLEELMSEYLPRIAVGTDGTVRALQELPDNLPDPSPQTLPRR